MLNSNDLQNSNNIYINKLPQIIANLGLWDTPTSFDNSASWYQALKYVCEYMLNKLIPHMQQNDTNIEELTTLYNEIKTYVDNYFNNLDVQDEINNKLDKMATDGTLENIIAEFLKLTSLITFDTLTDLKNSTNLINGSFAKTLGYYNINDNGSGIYKIRNITNYDKVDEGHLIALNNNQLVAELIEENYNIKQFGAKGDGLTDDTQAFINAIKFLEKNNTLYLPFGHYKITQTINLPDTISLKGQNSVPYIEYFGENTLIQLIGHEQQSPETNDINSNAERKPVLSNICLFNTMSEKYVYNYYGVPNSIAINFNNSNSNLDMSRIYFENVQIWHFDKAIQLGTLNCFILTFKRINFEHNNNVFDVPQTVSNSGEKVSLINCLFDSNQKVFHFRGSLAYDFNIIESSLDYNVCIIYNEKYVQYGSRKLTFINCHIETNNTENNDNSPHGIQYGSLSGTRIDFIACKILTNILEKQFLNPQNLNGKTRIYFTKCYIQFWDTDFSSYVVNRFYWIDTNCANAFLDDCSFGIADMCMPISYTQLLNSPGCNWRFQTGTLSKDNNNVLKDNNNYSTFLKIINENNVESYNLGNLNSETGLKDIEIIPSSINSAIVTFSNSYNIYDINKFNLIINALTKNILKLEIRSLYYNINNNIIGDSGWLTLFDNNNIEDKYILIPHNVGSSLNYENITGKYSVNYQLRVTTIPGKKGIINAIALF